MNKQKEPIPFPQRFIKPKEQEKPNADPAAPREQDILTTREARDKRYREAQEKAQVAREAREADLKKRAQRARIKARGESPPPSVPKISSALIEEERNRRAARKLRQRLSQNTPENTTGESADENRGNEPEQKPPFTLMPLIKNKEDRARVREILMNPGENNES